MSLRPILAAACVAALCVVATGQALAQSGSWREGAPLERPRAALAATEINGRVYVAGGAGLLSPSADFDVYDAGLGAWTQLNPLPTGRARFGMASLDGKIYIVGGSSDGEDASVSGDVYDPESDVWSAISDLPGPRVGHGLAAVSGVVVAIGGGVDAIDVYDVELDVWTRRAGPDDVGRSGAAVAPFGDRIYLIGGRSDDAASARVDIYDVSADTWSRGPNLPQAHTGLAAAVVDGRLHVLGGANAAGLEVADDHWVLNADGGGWSSAASLPGPRADFAAVNANGMLVVVGGGGGGGFFGPFTPISAVDVFVPGS